MDFGLSISSLVLGLYIDLGLGLGYLIQWAYSYFNYLMGLLGF